jgi:ubiquinone/menaquinone biosynthesis C-methylase UbiE
MRHHHGGTIEGRSRTRFYSFMTGRLMRSVYRRIAADIADAAPRDGDLLDVGTGPGWLLVEIARSRPDLRLTGIDPSADMTAIAGRNVGNRATLHVAGAESLPFPDDSFDVVVSSFSLHHWENPATAVSEFRRVLRDGGRVNLYDFRFAPFDTVGDAAREVALPVRETTFRMRVPPFRSCIRQVLTTG